MFLEICMQTYSVVFVDFVEYKTLSYFVEVDKLTSKKYANTFNFLCASNKDFVKYQAQGGGLTATPPPPLHTPLLDVNHGKLTKIQFPLDMSLYCATCYELCHS